MYELPVEIFLTIGKEIMKNVAVPMSIIMPASILGLLILLISSWKTRSVYFYCIFTALILFIAALIITLTIEVPIDNQIAKWTVETIPAGWRKIRDKWEFYHTIRTFVSLTVVIFFMMALIKQKQVALN